MELKIKLLNDKAQAPQKMNPDDAAFDCYVNDIKHIDDTLVMVKLGFSVEVPKGYQLNLVPRSSIYRTRWILANSIGLIDSGYKNEVCAIFKTYVEATKQESSQDPYLTTLGFPYTIGDRCCQIYLQEVIPTTIKIVNEINGTREGLGSTGK